MVKETKQSKYKDLRFNTEKEFDRWLAKTATMTIDFKDHGQDLVMIWIDEEGEILHANLQTAVWCGKFVNTQKIIMGEPVQVWGHATMDWQITKRLIIEKYKKLK